VLPPVNPADRGAVSQKTGLPPQGRCGPEAGHPPQLAEADPVRRSRQARTKILDTLVEISGDTASDASSTLAASTKPNPVEGLSHPHAMVGSIDQVAPPSCEFQIQNVNPKPIAHKSFGPPRRSDWKPFAGRAPFTVTGVQVRPAKRHDRGGGGMETLVVY
jgi:hypothetical protein